MFERHQRGDRAILVSIDFGDRDYQAITAEIVELATSAGAQVLQLIEGKRQRPDAATFAGKGKVEEIARGVAECDADMVIFNHELSPAQERNLEREVRARVLDRTTLILDIFAQRARSHEGKLQVELAQLRHVATRLVRGWTHLERQKGGIGLRGPGETQIETDRRLIAKRVKLLRERLDHVRRRRAIQRGARRRGRAFAISIVGYTNAGKSTSFNRLTGADSLAAEKVFATLDTVTRRMYVPDAGSAVISDTVGFIRQLPHDLVAAFRATLEETIEADLLLHVIDTSAPDRDQRILEVDRVLAEIGAENVAQVLVYNKIDLVPGLTPALRRDECGTIAAVYASAGAGLGIELIRQAVAESMVRAESLKLADSEPAGAMVPLAADTTSGVGAEENFDPVKI